MKNERAIVSIANFVLLRSEFMIILLETRFFKGAKENAGAWFNFWPMIKCGCYSSHLRIL